MLTYKQNVHFEIVQHVLGVPLIRAALLFLTSCKQEPQRFLLTDNENYNKTRMTDTVPPFPPTILQEICFSMDESSYGLQF
jgi:hypothetical protein